MFVVLGFAACGDGATPATDTTPARSDTADDTVASSDIEVSDTVAETSAPDVDDTVDEQVEEVDVVVGGPSELVWYDPDVLHEVVIDLDPDDWDALRHETRTLLQILGPDCLAAPPPDVFSWYHADVTVDGAHAQDVGLKKKGFLGSLDENRPALRVETDHFVDHQHLGELEHLTLNNGRQDPSRVRQCLAYEVFRAAGVAASRCSFVHVIVNGADLGLYVNVEPVRKAFVADAYGLSADGQLWEGALSDFREGWTGTFESKLDDVPSDKGPLDAVTAALARPDDEVIAALDALVDLDELFTFWATEGLIGHWDGYAGNTNNFYVFRAPDGRLRFIPWGVDGTFVDPAARGDGQPTSVFAVGALARRLYQLPEGRARYQAELRRLLSDVWDEQALIDRVAAWDTLTFGAREDDSGAAGSEGIADLKLFVAGRRAAILAELDGGDADWPGELRAPICVRAIGTVSGTLSTSWGTLAVDDLFTTGTSSIVLDSADLPPLTYDLHGAKAGEDTQNQPGRAQLVTAAHVVGAGYVVVVITTALPLGPGARAINGTITDAVVYYLDPGGNAQIIGYVEDGAVTLEQAGTESGSPIVGSFEGTMFNF